MKSKLSVMAVTAGCLCLLTVASAHEWMAPKKERSIKNPVKRDEAVLKAGEIIYQEFCMECHGSDGKGLAPEKTGLGNAPPDLKKTLKTHSDGGIFWKIQTGRNEMPSFKKDLEAEEIWSVIHYIRSF